MVGKVLSEIVMRIAPAIIVRAERDKMIEEKIVRV